MASELQDLGKQLVVNCERDCWVASISQQQVTFRGNLNSILKTLELAVETLKKGL